MKNEESSNLPPWRLVLRTITTDDAYRFFNLTNRANFGNTFAVNIRSATFGQPTEFITPARTILPDGFAAEMGAKFSF